MAKWKHQKPERDTHFRNNYEVLGKETDTKICIDCGVEQSINFFNVARLDHFNRRYTKNTCKKCDSKHGKRVKVLHRIFSDVKPSHCPICKEDKKLSPDHCHKTMAFRGWLCKECNVLLGKGKDNPQIFINAIEYLQKDPIPDPPKQQMELDLNEME